MAALDERIKAQEEKLKQLKALKQKQEAQKRAAEAKRTRTEDTRRKILVGAAILAKVERGEWPKDKMLEMMGQQLTRNDDRALFGLPPKGAGMLSREEQISFNVLQAENGAIVGIG